MKNRSETIGIECLALSPEGRAKTTRQLICEEPLLITVGATAVATLMCTPGDELALTLGFLYTEGIIRSAKEVGAMAFCPEASGNVVRVIPAEGIDLSSRLTGFRTVFSSCSICGDEAIHAVASGLQPFAKSAGRLSPRAIFELAALMNQNQRFFKGTGGTHAAMLGRIHGGRLDPASAIIKEDIGRHNALDKVVGEALHTKAPLEESLLFLSGRMSFEMVSKAARAGISDLAAVSAPTALAVQLAGRLGMFLAGFVRGETLVVYSGAEALTIG